MDKQYLSMTNLRFLLFEVNKVSRLFEHEKFSHIDSEQAWMMIQSAKELADLEMFPYYQEMDSDEPQYQSNGSIKTHPQLKVIIEKIAEQGWIGAGDSFDNGGMQMPHSIYNAAQHIFQAANNGVQGYIGLSSGAARLISTFGTRDQIEQFVHPIYEGSWQGTMALTETQAGSSLSDIKTTAYETDKDYYHIKGQKIFISAGQHEACENFIHLTLARIEGAPAGIKGISLFIIPKFRQNKHGELTENDVFCAGEYHKMGQKCYTTTHLVMGDQDNCRGYLLGKPHEGLKYMFLMMNEARIGVGQTAASVANAAYYSSLKYVFERTQGRPPDDKDPLAEPVPLIRHADIQRMLLTQKAISEGALCLCITCNYLFDRIQTEEEGRKKDLHLLLELLTPIAKTYSSEEGSRSVALAIQTLGGYGYTIDFPVQQYYRDIKIMSIYEGTTGIQSIDLLGRKVLQNKSKAIRLLQNEIQQTIAAAKKHAEIEVYAELLEDYSGIFTKVLESLLKRQPDQNMEKYLADATVFMELTGIYVIGWQWIHMALCAVELLNAKNRNVYYSDAFLQGKIHTMKFFFTYEMSRMKGYQQVFESTEILTMLKDYDWFK